MKNIVIIGVVIVAIGYMFVMMADRFNSIKKTNEIIAKQQNTKSTMK